LLHVAEWCHSEFPCNPTPDAQCPGMRISFLIFRGVLGALLLVAGLGSGRKPSDATPVPPKRSSWVMVKEFAKEHGFTSVKVLEDEVRLKGRVHALHLRKDSRKAELNGTLIWLNQPMTVRKKRWHLSRLDVDKTLLPLIHPTDALKGQGYHVVVLDAGHGGEDPGALSAKGRKEKEVALDVTRRVRGRLMKAGYKVYLTRHDDSFVELKERARRAKSWKADLFVSLHANSGPKTAKGLETFVLSLPGQRSTNQKFGSTVSKQTHPGNKYDQASMALGYAIHHQVRSSPGGLDRGVKRARFLVLKEAPCPSALVEIGFLSNKEEAAKLATSAHREKLAASIALGIENYLRGVRKAVVDQTKTKTPSTRNAE